MENRRIKVVEKGHGAVDGAGVKLTRVLSHPDVYDIDPFLMLDAFGSDDPEDYRKGFPMHPHKGVETLTYLLEGSMKYGDVGGKESRLSGGELQWVTAGSGILHEEMPLEPGRLEWVQLWLNLPAKEKGAAPGCRMIPRDKMTDIKVEGGNVRLIAGTYNGVKGNKGDFVEITMLDIRLDAESRLLIPTAEEDNVFIYLLEGSGCFDESSRTVEKRSAAIFGSGGAIAAEAGADGVRFLLLAGKPLREPISWAGPVVMNTEEEIHRAFRELQDGTFLKE